jgi:PAS domain S-box-containing protein
MSLPETPSAGTSDRCERVDEILVELSARFISLPPDQVDGAIREAQRRLCEYLHLQRSSLFQLPAEDAAGFRPTHVFQTPGMPPPPSGNPDLSLLFPWALSQLQQGRTIVVRRLDDLPEEAARDRASLKEYGTGALVVVPLRNGSSLFGALTFASGREFENWTDSLVRRLQLVAEVFANAITRAAGDRALRESETRLRMTAESAGAGLWDMEVDSGRVWASPKLREMVLLDPEEPLDYDRFLGSIHPEDRRSVSEAVERALRSGTELQVEYRVPLPDGSHRWIQARGRSSAARASTEPARLMGVSVDVTDRRESDERLRRSLDEVRRLQDELRQQNVYLRQEVQALGGHTRLVGESEALRRVKVQIEQVASTGSTVLLLGETGTGKELIASRIHELSPRADRPMVRVSCSAIPTSLIESELFGREKGAYTGALSKQVGRFELADGSTLFLDEIGDLPLDVQVKLLRVLEERRFERLGSPRSIPVDVRIIAATHRDLAKAVREGMFREDLYYRLNVFPITVPPLRERRDDIPALVSLLVGEFAPAMGRKIESIDRTSLAMLERHDWPGNVRELRNVVERALILARGPKLWIEPPAAATPGPTADATLMGIERAHILGVLAKTGWRVRGKNGAAAVLGVKPTTLESRMARLGIRRDDRTRTK